MLLPIYDALALSAQNAVAKKFCRNMSSTSRQLMAPLHKSEGCYHKLTIHMRDPLQLEQNKAVFKKLKLNFHEKMARRR